MDKLLSILAAAEALGGISPWTLRSWLSQGRLPRVKVGARTMVRESDLLKFLAECDPSTRGGSPTAHPGESTGDTKGVR